MLIGLIYLYWLRRYHGGVMLFVADFRRLKSKLRVYQIFAYVVYIFLNGGGSISLQLAIQNKI